MTDQKSKVVGWFDAAVLKGVAWSIGVITPMFITLALWIGDKYLSMEVKVASMDASQLKAADLNRVQDTIRNAIQDALKPIENRIASDEQRMTSIEARH